MREILFRGTSEWLDNWVYGSLVLEEDLDFVCILPRDIEENNTEVLKDYNYPYISKGGIIDGRLISIDKNTIGQYIGLNDKNGKKIFEGDIVKFTHDAMGQWVGDVFLDENGVCWNAHLKYLGKDLPLFDGDCIGLCFSADKYEIIGNIYDNPDLLEVEDERKTSN